MKWKKYYYYLLGGLGISELGNWIYLIALNIAIWNLTHSPAAVAGLYIIGPIVKMLCGFVVGSYIDRLNKKRLVVTVDIIRGVLVCFMPFADQLWLIYVIVAATNIASSFFGPSSTYLIATHIAQPHLQKFNAISSTLSSGSFMIGPAVAGLILALSNTSVAMWINGASYLICALLLSCIPADASLNMMHSKKISWRTIQSDWRIVANYSKSIHRFVGFLVIYSIALMIAFALDSQEMTFLLSHLQISESLYGLTVTMAGVGAIIGGILATFFSEKWSVSLYIKGGFLLTMSSYLSFYFSATYAIAIISFVLLGIFMSFSNAGFATLYQKTIRKDLMGRFGSIVDLVQSMLQVLCTLIIGAMAEWFSVQFAAVIFASIAVILAFSIIFTQIEAETSIKEIEESQ